MGTATSKTPMLHPTVAKTYWVRFRRDGRFPWETECKRGTSVCGLVTKALASSWMFTESACKASHPST